MIAHVIHDSRHTDRLDRFVKEAKVQGFEFVIHQAVKSETKVEGVGMAHKLVVSEARERGETEVLIMEDDVKFTAPGAFNFFIRKKPVEFDLYLGGIMTGTPKKGMVPDFSGLHCYIVAARFYDVFLSAGNTTFGNTANIDRWLTNKGLFKVCMPMIAFQWDPNNKGGYDRLTGKYPKYHRNF